MFCLVAKYGKLETTLDKTKISPFNLRELFSLIKHSFQDSFGTTDSLKKAQGLERVFATPFLDVYY